MAASASGAGRALTGRGQHASRRYLGRCTAVQATGIVKSVDLDSEVLNVDNVNGKSTEIFPIKKKVHVVTADGGKLKLAKLKPGTNVLVYYEQRGDHKTVTRIVVLARGAEKKKTPPY